MFTLQWTTNNTLVTGNVYFSVGFPNYTSTPLELIITSPAISLGTQEIITGLSFYLDGPDAAEIISWTTISPKPTLNGGFQMSFDQGRSWITFNTTTGYKANPSTWVPLASTAIGSLGVQGVLNPSDAATILVRLVVPPSVTDYGVYTFLIGADFDVI